MVKVQTAEKPWPIDGPPCFLEKLATKRLLERFARFASSTGNNVHTIEVALHQHGLISK
jgi:hypothetical protein